MQTLQRGLSGQPVTNSTTIASSTRSSFQVGHVRTLFTHSDLSGLEDTSQFFWYVFAPGRAIYSRPLGSTDRILNILRIKYRCGRSRTQFWRGQTNVNKPHSFGWRCPSPPLRSRQRSRFPSISQMRRVSGDSFGRSANLLPCIRGPEFTVPSSPPVLSWHRPLATNSQKHAHLSPGKRLLHHQRTAMMGNSL